MFDLNPTGLQMHWQCVNNTSPSQFPPTNLYGLIVEAQRQRNKWLSSRVVCIDLSVSLNWWVRNHRRLHRFRTPALPVSVINLRCKGNILHKHEQACCCGGISFVRMRRGSRVVPELVHARRYRWAESSYSPRWLTALQHSPWGCREGKKNNTFVLKVSQYGWCELLQLARHGNRFNSSIKHCTSKIWQPDVTAGVTWKIYSFFFFVFFHFSTEKKK